MEFINKCCHTILPFHYNGPVVLIKLGHPDILTGLLKCVCMTGLENHLYMNISYILIIKPTRCANFSSLFLK